LEGGDPTVLRVATAQLAGVWEDPVTTLAQAERMVAQAADAGAHLICFPEQFATGWSPHIAHWAEEMGGPVTGALSSLASQYGIGVLGSFVERHTPKPRNTCVVFDSEGTSITTYAKIHLFTPGHEDRDLESGDHLSLFEMEGVRMGIAICYDLRFGPLFHLYALRGVHGIIIPAAWPCRRIRQWELLVAARALEQQCYVVGVNRTGSTPFETYCGVSLTANPEGTIVTRGGDADELFISEIDPAKVLAARQALQVLGDYRDSLYRTLGGGQP